MSDNSSSSSVDDSISSYYPFEKMGDNSHEATFFGLPLTTGRLLLSSGSGSSDNGGFGGGNEFASDVGFHFHYEIMIAVISIVFFRATVHYAWKNEPVVVRYGFAALLGFLTYYSFPTYDTIIAVEMFSYLLPWFLYEQSESSSYYYHLFTKTLVANNVTQGKEKKETTMEKIVKTVYYSLIAIIFATLSMLIVRFVSSGNFYSIICVKFTPEIIKTALNYLFPVTEFQSAYDIIKHFVNENVLQHQIYHLLFVTFHIQFGMGFLGIGFLRSEQSRRNQLIRIVGNDDSNDNNDDEAEEEGKEKQSQTKMNEKESTKTAKSKSNGKEKRFKKFQRSAAPFIFLTAVPYMAQLIFYGNINRYASLCMFDDIHRTVRLNQVFKNENHFLSLTTQSTTTPEAYANSMSTVVSTVYDLFNRKLFSLPKLLLMPSIISKQPMLLIKIFPFIFFSDYFSGRVVSYLTKQIESLQKEIVELSSIRNKIENFDIKNAELLQRSSSGGVDMMMGTCSSGSREDKACKRDSSNTNNNHNNNINGVADVGGTSLLSFTMNQWHTLTIHIQQKTVIKDLISRTKMFFSWLQRNFVFGVLVDCALAELLSIGKILSAEVFVFSRAIEDAIDTALMRSRSEAELARMVTEINKLSELVTIWDKSKSRQLLHCHIMDNNKKTSVLDNSDSTSVTTAGGSGDTGSIVIRNLYYTRGTAAVRADHVEISPGIYALTGANGSGKSTLFRILMSCNTNKMSVDLPSSILFETPRDPLIEEDDVERATACSKDGEEEEEENKSVNSCSNDDNKIDAEADGSSSCNADDSNSAESTILPKLSVNMPSSDVVEISQTFYWPLYARPIDWIYQEYVSEKYSEEEVQMLLQSVAEHLQSLTFFASPKKTATSTKKGEQEENLSTDDEDTTATVSTNIDNISGGGGDLDIVIKELSKIQVDWFDNLSGGQKSKVELVRKVFIQKTCPSVLLIDETMAPLDPASKSLVMEKIKLFCKGSIVIVIYHTDIQQESSATQENEKEQDCVPSSNFFDYNLHLENQMVHIRPVC